METKSYTAKVPMFVSQGLPAISQESTPSENDLKFTFYHPGKSGVFGGQPKVEVQLSLIPHPSLDNHLIVNELAGTMSQMGKWTDLIQYMELKNPNAIFDMGELRGLCLDKL